MRFFRFFCFAILLLGFSACQKPMEMTSDLQPGQYKIAMIDIQPATDELADNPEYWRAKKLIMEGLQKKLPYYGRPPHVGLKITINRINLSINAVQALLVGDNYFIGSFNQLWDVNTKHQLAKTTTYANGHGVGGIGGLAGHGIATSTVDLEQRLADEYVETMMKQLYPKTYKSKN